MKKKREKKQGTGLDCGGSQGFTQSRRGLLRKGAVAQTGQIHYCSADTWQGVRLMAERYELEEEEEAKWFPVSSFSVSWKRTHSKCTNFCSRHDQEPVITTSERLVTKVTFSYYEVAVNAKNTGTHHLEYKWMIATNCFFPKIKWGYTFSSTYASSSPQFLHSGCCWCRLGVLLKYISSCHFLEETFHTLQAGFWSYLIGLTCLLQCMMMSEGGKKKERNTSTAISSLFINSIAGRHTPLVTVSTSPFL